MDLIGPKGKLNILINIIIIIYMAVGTIVLVIFMFHILCHLYYIWLMSLSELCVVWAHRWTLPELRLNSSDIWGRSCIEIVRYCFNISSSYIWLIFVPNILLDVFITSIFRDALIFWCHRHTSFILILITSVGTHIGILLGIINLLRLFNVHCFTDRLNLLFFLSLDYNILWFFDLFVHFGLVFISCKLLVFTDMNPRGLLSRLLANFNLSFYLSLYHCILLCCILSNFPCFHSFDYFYIWIYLLPGKREIIFFLWSMLRLPMLLGTSLLILFFIHMLKYFLFIKEFLLL